MTEVPRYRRDDIAPSLSDAHISVATMRETFQVKIYRVLRPKYKSLRRVCRREGEMEFQLLEDGVGRCVMHVLHACFLCRGTITVLQISRNGLRATWVKVIRSRCHALFLR